jgi:hypothetical protein
MSASYKAALLGLSLLAFACAAPADEGPPDEPAEADFTQAVSVESLRSAFAGEWTSVASESSETSASEPVRIVVDANRPARDSDSPPENLVVEMLTPSNVRFRDRAQFTNIGEPKRCSTVRDGADFARICHKSTFNGKVLTHTMTYSAFTLAVPRGSSTAVQTLSVDGAQIRYVYSVDNTVSEELTFRKR